MRHCGDNDSLQQQSRPDRDAPVSPLPCDASAARKGAREISSLRARRRCVTAAYFCRPRPSIPQRGGSQPGWESAAPHSRNLALLKPPPRRLANADGDRCCSSCFPETGDRYDCCVQNGQCCRASPALRQRSHGPDTQGRRDADQNYFQKRALCNMHRQ